MVLFRAFKRARSPSLFLQLAALVRKIHPRIMSGTLDELPVPPSTSTVPPSEKSNGAPQPSQLVPQLYFLYAAFDIIEQKVDQVARDRKYNIILILSLLWVFVQATIVFGLLHWALFKIDPSAFTGVQ